MTAPSIAPERPAEVGRRLHTGPVSARLYRIADKTGQVYEHEDPDFLRRWLFFREKRAEEMAGRFFPETLTHG